MTNTTEPKEYTIENSLLKVKDCVKCNAGIAVTTEGLCEYCDRTESGIEKPAPHQ